MGWVLSPQQVGPKRLAPQTLMKILLLSGNWTRPAMGVLTTTISGLQAAKMILIREGLSEPLADIGTKNGFMK